MNSYVNDYGIDSNRYYLDQYMQDADTSYEDAVEHDYYVEADIYYTEHEDVNDDGCLDVHLDGYIRLKEGFEEQDLDDMSLQEKLAAVGFDKESYPNCYDIIDVDWSIDI